MRESFERVVNIFGDRFKNLNVTQTVSLRGAEGIQAVETHQSKLTVCFTTEWRPIQEYGDRQQTNSLLYMGSAAAISAATLALFSSRAMFAFSVAPSLIWAMRDRRNGVSSRPMTC